MHELISEAADLRGAWREFSGSGKLGTADDLVSFMRQVDDLTAATKTSDGLLLGGRKILGRTYRAITIEEVATIWQAEQKIKAALEKVGAQVEFK